VGASGAGGGGSPARTGRALCSRGCTPRSSAAEDRGDRQRRLAGREGAEPHPPLTAASAAGKPASSAASRKEWHISRRPGRGQPKGQNPCARTRRPFAGPLTGEQGSRRSASMATAKPWRGTDCPRQGVPYQLRSRQRPPGRRRRPARGPAGTAAAPGARGPGHGIREGRGGQAARPDGTATRDHGKRVREEGTASRGGAWGSKPQAAPCRGRGRRGAPVGPPAPVAGPSQGRFHALSLSGIA